MAEKCGKPEIRFAGFADAWEQHKVGELAEQYIGGGTPSTAKSEYWNGSLPWIQSSDLTENILFDVSPRKRITEAGLLKSATKLVAAGSIAIITRVGVGKLAYMPYAYATSQDILSLSKLKADGQFVVYAFYQMMQKELHNVQGTSIKGITNDELLQKTVVIPRNAVEQAKMGKFFHSLDNLVSLHQRKHDKLANMKKAMLGKMFPQDGASVPEVRFAGFTDAWEQRKLGELYTERNERGNDTLQILSVSIHHGVSSGELDIEALGKQVRRSEDKSLYKHVYFGDLVFNMMRAWQGAIGVVKTEGMVSPAYITAIPNELVYPLFMDCCLSRNEIIAQMNNLSYGVTDFRKRLYWDSFIMVSCRIPSVPEQARIASYFDHLDTLINLQQRKLEKLQNLKKALLEKMFV